MSFTDYNFIKITLLDLQNNIGLNAYLMKQCYKMAKNKNLVNYYNKTRK